MSTFPLTTSKQLGPKNLVSCTNSAKDYTLIPAIKSVCAVAWD